jgi:hypothetical protein
VVCILGRIVSAPGSTEGGEMTDEDYRREQRLRLIETQLEALQQAVKLARDEEAIERIPPQPEKRAALRVMKAG